MSQTVRCMIVDDEPLARQRQRELLLRLADTMQVCTIEIIAEAKSATEAIPLIYELKPDVVFLDIQMPGVSGFELLDFLPEPRPHIVFVTAYDAFALRAFEVHALDYLTKPVSLERLSMTLERLLSVQHIQSQRRAVQQLQKERQGTLLSRLTVHEGQSLRVIALSDIRRIEAEDKVVQVYTLSSAMRTDFTLDELEARLDAEQFMRIHRSHLVRIDAIREIIPWFSGSYCVKLEDGTQLPVARRRVPHMKKIFGKR